MWRARLSVSRRVANWKMSSIRSEGIRTGLAGMTRESARSLKRTLTQSRHIGRPRARRRPMEAAILFRDRDIVDAGFAAAHQAVLVELPLLVAIGTMPLSGSVMPLVLEAVSYTHLRAHETGRNLVCRLL